MILPKENDFKKLKEILKFVKASNWSSATTPRPVNKPSSSKIPDSETSPQNTLGILKDTSGLNFLSLNEEKSNPQTPPITGKLISPPGTPDTELLITKKMLSEDITDKSLRNLYEGISNLRFGVDIEENLFQQSSQSFLPKNQ